MGDLLLGACLGLAAWFVLQTLVTGAVHGRETTITWGDTFLNGALALLCLFVAVLTYVGVL